MIEIDKKLIKQRFAKSITTYSECAKAQKQIAEHLAQKIKEYTNGTFQNALELGAGTGFLTQQILQKISINKLTCNDMVEEYKELLQAECKKTNTSFDFIPCDLENTKNFTETYDLIASSSALQWIVELEQLFAQLHLKLKEQGIFAFSTFGKKNLIEFRKILRQGLYYPDLDFLLSILKKNFTIDYFAEQEIIMQFASPIEVLKHIKNTGVNSLIRTKLTKQKLNQFNTQYLQNYTSEKGVKLTYHPIYIIAKKK